MTIVIGMLSSEGDLVMGADAEETDLYMKVGVSKLPLHLNGNGDSLIIGGSGSGAYIDSCTQHIQKEFGHDLTANDLPAIEERFNKAIHAYYRKHILCWPSESERTERTFELLIAASFRPTKDKHALSRLWSTSSNALKNVPIYDAIGIGSAYAKTLLREHYTHMLYLKRSYSATMAALTAFFILRRVKRDVPGCGKESNIWRVVKGQPLGMRRELYLRIEDLFKRYDEIELGLLWNTVLDPISASDLGSDIDKLRKEFKAIVLEMNNQVT